MCRSLRTAARGHAALRYALANIVLFPHRLLRGGEPIEELTQYIKADFAVLVAVLYCIGRGLKAIQRFPNQFIPLALTFCGIGLACLSVVSRYASYGNWAAALFEGVVQGVLCAGMSVYLNEVIAHCSSNKGNDPPN